MSHFSLFSILTCIIVANLPSVYSDTGSAPLVGRVLGVLKQHISLSLLTVAATGVALTWLLKHYNTAQHVKQLVSNIRGKPRRLKGIKILYGTQTGTAKYFASLLEKDAEKRGIKVTTVNLKDYDPEDSLPLEAESGYLLVVVIATYTDGTPPEDAAWFHKWLHEGASDFRLSKNILKGLEYAVVGLGNSLYKGNFCQVAYDIDTALEALGGSRRILPVGTVDENVAESKHGGKEADFSAWTEEFWTKALDRFSDPAEKKKKCSCSKQKCCTKRKDDAEASSDEEEGGGDIVDIEDLVGASVKLPKRQVERKVRQKAKVHRSQQNS